MLQYLKLIIICGIPSAVPPTLTLAMFIIFIVVDVDGRQVQHGGVGTVHGNVGIAGNVSGSVGDINFGPTQGIKINFWSWGKDNCKCANFLYHECAHS